MSVKMTSFNWHITVAFLCHSAFNLLSTWKCCHQIFNCCLISTLDKKILFLIKYSFAMHTCSINKWNTFFQFLFSPLFCSAFFVFGWIYDDEASIIQSGRQDKMEHLIKLGFYDFSAMLNLREILYSFFFQYL